MVADLSAARLTPHEKNVLTLFVAEARRLLGRELLETHLFGSRARGEGGPDSDIDVLLIVTADGFERREEILVASVLLRRSHSVHIDALVLERDYVAELRRQGRQIISDVDRDCIRLPS